MAKLGKLVVGIKDKPTIIGIINISPESFYKNSIKTTKTKNFPNCKANGR